MTAPARIVHCPSLGRDLSPILAQVPDARVQLADRTPGTHAGCIGAHQAIVREAQAQRWPAVWVLEDDCSFTPAFSLAQWWADLGWAAAHGFTMLVGGCAAAAKPRRVRDGLVAVTRFKSSHCVAYLAAAYEIVLRLVEPMDLMLGRLGGRPVVTVPFVAVQAPGFSGIQQRPVDYRGRYDRIEASLRGLACAS